MSNFNLIDDEEFLEIAGFENNTSVPVQNKLSTSTESRILIDQEAFVPSEYMSFQSHNFDECDDRVSEDESFYTSDNSFDSDGGLFREELHYDVEEMYGWRATNRSLRQNQLNETVPQEAEITTQEPCEQDQGVEDDSSHQRSRFWTTYEGGYVSDQRSSEDESRKLSDDESDVDLPVHKRMKGTEYKLFNDKTDLRNVELSVGLRFTSRKIFKEVILAYSIQQHKDLVYMKNDKMHIHLGCSLCKWELTAGPDLSDATGWQIKSMQPVHNCMRTMNNRLITESWLTKEYLDKILKDPLMTPAQIKDDMKVRYGIVVGSKKCQRAKEKALNAKIGSMEIGEPEIRPKLVFSML